MTSIHNEFTIYQVDAFTSEIFKGNPAAIVPLKEWLPDDLLTNIAAENNLSETAFFVPNDDGSYHLRWFTPTVEVDLCGHATLATSHVIFNIVGHQSDTIEFDSKSGKLFVTKNTDGYTLNFPIWDYKKIELDPRIDQALGHPPTELYEGYDWVAMYDDPQIVRNMTPDMEKLSAISEMRGILATAPGDQGYDFISRFFGPNVGVPEDPVTGSAHCILSPIWAEKLQKTKFLAYQASSRGGELICDIKDGRVYISGKAALYLKGTIYV